MTNRLINEQSPYLLQHAHNPVDWYPWGDEPFEIARKENKPVLVSIGYSACHWCHVMEHESFEDEEVAAFMNTHFVCIKVDREEHPDVDHLYMDAVQSISGSGGWPLNVFVTPERYPFYGGTYYPPRPAYSRPSWLQVLGRMAEIWQDQPEEVNAQAEQMIRHLKQASKTISGPAGLMPDKEYSGKIAANLLKQADKEKGGFGHAPKFPGTMAISFLLEYHHFTGDEPALRHALRSLDAMAEGGIYDQLAGGFARYSIDRDWLAPHFEKMLYDNALLVCSYCDAYSLTHEERYRKIIEETIAFTEAELKNEAGGYYCALDADSEGVEGKFYTWTWDEWLEASFDVEGIAADYFGIKPEGNWEETNILHIAKGIEKIAAERGLFPFEIRKVISDVTKNLLVARGERIRPQTDDKSLLSWNALMNIALSRAGVAIGAGKHQAIETGAHYLVRATEHMEWMIGCFETNGTLKHAWKNGNAKITANLDDYAFLTQALIQLGCSTGENKWILKAAELVETVIEKFSTGEDFFYFTSEEQADIPVRKVELYDGALPSANSVMAHNLQVLGLCMERREWLEKSTAMLSKMSENTVRYPYSFAYWAILIQRKTEGIKTVICSGKNADLQKAEIQRNFLPQAVFFTLRKEIFDLPILKNKYFEDKNSIFVCSEEMCLSPVSSAGEALHQIRG